MQCRISKMLQNLSPGWVVLLSLLVFLLFTALVLPAQAAQAELASQGAASPDTSLFYTAAELYEMARAYGEVGRQAYIRARFTFDLLWPLVYLTFLATSLSWIYQRAFPPASSWQNANLVPFLAALLDYSENISTSRVMSRYPNLTPGIAGLAGIFTFLKWLLVSGSLLLLLLGLLVDSARWLRKKKLA
jgi:hypothetical protein